MTKRVAIVQSNYIPWKGYFDLIGSVDEFVLYDDVQFTRRDWRNRNYIKTPNGLQLLTVPVQVKGRFLQLIRETLIEPGDWAARHRRSLETNYRRAAAFEAILALVSPLYDQPFTAVSDLNRTFIEAIVRYLNIRTRISLSSDYILVEGKSERLADICRQAGADVYVSGPAARDYLDVKVFEAIGIEVEWFDYEGYPPYPQLWGPFEHRVSILDLLFNCGPEAPRYMKFRSRS
jgi:hypothetical protein